MLFPLASKMRQYLQQRKPCNISETLAAYDYAMGESVWETLKKDTHWKRGFDDSMTYRNEILSVPWHAKYPFERKMQTFLSNLPMNKTDLYTRQELISTTSSPSYMTGTIPPP